jgi:metalloendopeptidase OMA1, mitochondrial
MKTFVLGLCLFSLLGCVTAPESDKQAIILTSENDEAELGRRAYAEVLSKERVSTNGRWNQILQRLGGRVSTAARKPDFKWEFKLIESKEKNAFCLPGGKVAFYTGIFSTAVNEAGLAAVMGHEAAHATARHAGQRITLAFGTQLALEGLNTLFGGGSSHQKGMLMAALGLGAQVGVALPFSRGNESEADQMGLLYMARAGYDPREAVEFWRRFSGEGGSLPKFLSTHPPSEERMKALAEQVPKAMGEYGRSAQYGAGETL